MAHRVPSLSRSEREIHCGPLSCKYQGGKIVGLHALILGVVVLALACLLASGIMGAGVMYFVAVGVGIIGLVLLSVAAWKLLPLRSPIRE